MYLSAIDEELLCEAHTCDGFLPAFIREHSHLTLSLAIAAFRLQTRQAPKWVIYLQAQQHSYTIREHLFSQMSHSKEPTVIVSSLHVHMTCTSNKDKLYKLELRTYIEVWLHWWLNLLVCLYKLWLIVTVLKQNMLNSDGLHFIFGDCQLFWNNTKKCTCDTCYVSIWNPMQVWGFIICTCMHIVTCTRSYYIRTSIVYGGAQLTYVSLTSSTAASI